MNPAAYLEGQRRYAAFIWIAIAKLPQDRDRTLLQNLLIICAVPFRLAPALFRNLQPAPNN